MKVGIIHTEDMTRAISVFGMRNKENYSPQTVRRVVSAFAGEIFGIDGAGMIGNTIMHRDYRIWDSAACWSVRLLGSPGFWPRQVTEEKGSI